MTEIKVYKSIFQADQDLQDYYGENRVNEIRAERKLDQIPEGMELRCLDVCKDITFNYMVGLFSRMGKPKYYSVVGISHLFEFSADSPAGISIDALVKNVERFLGEAHNNLYGKVGVEMQPVFYTIEKEPGFPALVKRLKGAMKEGALWHLELINELDGGLDAQEREEFARLWGNE